MVRKLVAVASALLSTISLSGLETKTVHLANADTTLTLEAGAEAPRLSQLQQSGGFTWNGVMPEALIDHVENNGQPRGLHWRLNLTASQIKPGIVRLVYETGWDSQAPRLRLFWEWRARAEHGPLEHRVRIENLSGTDIWLPMQDSFRFAWSIPADKQLEQLWVEKGAGGPSADGTHRIQITDGYKWTGTSSTYAHPAPGQQREMIPYVLVDRPDAGGIGWYLGVEFSGRTRITLQRDGNSLKGVAGLNPEPGLFKTHLDPGEIFETPTIFLGTFRGGPDAAGNLLRRWVRDVLNNPKTVRDPEYPLVVNNSWGSGMAINESQARSMIHDSAELGFEMFHLDAGWFRGLGDWQPDPTKFPNGLAPIADYAHSLGLKFGLWMDWAQAGLDSRPGSLYVRDPKIRDWLTTDPPLDWKPVETFKGVTMDLGVPVVHDWAAAEVAASSGIITWICWSTTATWSRRVAIARIIRMPLRILNRPGITRILDFIGWKAPTIPTSATMQRARTTTSMPACGRSIRVSCSKYATTAAEWLILEAQLTEITFPFQMLMIQCRIGSAFYDSSYVLPPAMLETYVERWPTPKIENFLYVLRSGMMGWFTLMLDTTSWTPEQHATAKQAIALYKSRLRPLIQEADLYHVSRGRMELTGMESNTSTRPITTEYFSRFMVHRLRRASTPLCWVAYSHPRGIDLLFKIRARQTSWHTEET